MVRGSEIDSASARHRCTDASTFAWIAPSRGHQLDRAVERSVLVDRRGGEDARGEARAVWVFKQCLDRNPCSPVAQRLRYWPASRIDQLAVGRPRRVACAPMIDAGLGGPPAKARAGLVGKDQFADGVDGVQRAWTGLELA